MVKEIKQVLDDPDIEHQKDFIESIKSRKKSNGNIEQGHKSATLVHMANISYRAGNKQLYLDPGSETFTNSDEANDLDLISYRPGFELK